MNVSERLGIDQLGLKAQRLTGPNLLQSQIADVEFERRFSWPRRVDQQGGMGADEAIDGDADFPAAAETAHLAALVPRRNVQRQAIDEDGVHPHRFTEQTANRRLEA